MYAKTLLVFCLLLLCGHSAFAVRGPMAGITSDSKFIVYYGNDFYSQTSGSVDTWQLNQTTLNTLAAYDVVVLQPNQSYCTPEVVAALKQAGVDVVLGYISIGEDYINQSIEAPLANGAGMRRYNANTGQLDLTSDNALQSFYMDVDTQTVTYGSNGQVLSVQTAQRLVPDGQPDLNPHFHGLMVFPDANWRWVINNMRIGTHAVAGRFYEAGLQQLAGPRDANALRNRSANFGFDGFFLDTLDTAGPYDGAGWYPWSAQAMQQTVQFISDEYPNHWVLANRGAFFFSAGLKSNVTQEYSIDHSIRPFVNGFLFESFRYDSEPADDDAQGVSAFYNENRFNTAPKVLAEAARPDGFTVFSLDYQSGRTAIESDAFDVHVRQMGFSAYLAPNGDLNTHSAAFSSWLPDSQNDTQAPQWSDTGHTAYNTENPNRRVGVQALLTTAQAGEVVVQWDLAIDQSYPVHYDLVIEDVTASTITELNQVAFETTPEWLHAPQSHGANQYTLTGLQQGHSYRVKVIAEDTKGNRNLEDEGKTITLIAPISNPILKSDIVLDGLLSDWQSLSAYASDPDDVQHVSEPGHLSGAGNQANWRQIQMAHTTDTHELLMAYTNETNIYVSWGFQVFIDTDDDPTTGFQGGFAGIGQFPIGADYLIEGVNVYQYAGSGQDWQWVTSPFTAGYEVGRIWSGHTGEVFLPLHWIGSPSGAINFVVFGNNDFYVDGDTPIEYDWYPDNAAQGGYFRYQF